MNGRWHQQDKHFTNKFLKANRGTIIDKEDSISHEKGVLNFQAAHWNHMVTFAATNAQFNTPSSPSTSC